MDHEDPTSASMADYIGTMGSWELLHEGDCSPSQTLTRLLSDDILVSTPSSFTKRQQAAQAINDGIIKIIGEGQCGIVYENPGNPTVLKVAREEYWKEALWNDYMKHQKVLEAFENANFTSVLVPNTIYYIPRDGPFRDRDWWDEAEPKFPKDSVLSDVLVTERIPPLSKPIRETIIDEFFPEEQRLGAKGSLKNEDCLVRLYLGRRRDLSNSRKAPKVFTLRNYCLHLDQMESLDLKVLEIGQCIAEALSIMHWGAKVDANDVEFVLGGVPGYRSTIVCRPTYERLQQLPPGAGSRNLVPKRTTHVWVLDFNRCKDISMDMAGVDRAVRAFYQNDPYFPRPLATRVRDQILWDTFKRHYLSYSETLLRREGASFDVLSLPEAFIEKAIEEQQRRLEARQRHCRDWLKGASVERGEVRAINQY